MALRPESAVHLVGREEAWDALAGAWDRVAHGERRVVLLAGEPGAGKSRLAAEFARHVHDSGAIVLHGSCSEGLELPYGPIREAVEELITTTGRSSSTDDLADLADLLGPLLGRRDADDGNVADVDERRAITASVTGLLEHLTELAPVLFVLDDLHWCHPATAAVLDQVAHGPRPRSCLLLVTHRTAPADVTPAARRLLADLRRRPGTARVTVGPLDQASIRAFVTAAAGHPIHLALGGVVDHLATESGGNPFFLGELWRHLVETGRLVRPHGWWRLEGPIDPGPSPASVREVIALRLERLDDDARRAVECAAVIGTSFDLRLLGMALGRPPASVLADLEPPQQLELISEYPAGTGRFSHELVRRAAYDGQPADLRHRRHLDVAMALEANGREGMEVAIASHLIAAVPLVEPAHAVAAAASSATTAFRARRWADAAAALHAALQVAEHGVDSATLLLDHAEASMRAGDVEAAQASAAEAHRLGMQSGDAALAVRAAIAFDEANWRAALPGQESQRVVEAALELATQEGDRRRLRAARARALALRGRDEEARTEAEDVIATARAVGDVDALGLAHAALLFSRWDAHTVDRFTRVSEDFVDLATSVGNREWELWALDKRLHGTVTLGDLDVVRELAPRHRTLAEGMGQPLFRVLDRQLGALVAVGEGRFAEAEALATEALREGTNLSGRDASGGFGVQMFSLRREQGRLDEARGEVEVLTEEDATGTWQPALAVLCAELGLHDRARSLLDELVADDLRALPRDSLWPATLAYLSEAATALGHAEAAARLLPELEPYRGLVVQAGTFLAAYGAADRYLGMLASVAGAPGATGHFESALRLESRARMPVWLARTQAEYGRHLLGTGEPDAAERAATLLRFAADTARRLGMASVEAAATSALVGVPPSHRSRPPAAAELTDRELAVLRLLAEGASNRQIGQALSISHHTAANHVRAILLKAGCANRTEAAAWALRLGLVPER